jgi:molybdopterin synthase catalytic subunit
MMDLLSADLLRPERLREAVADPTFGAILVFEGVARNHFEGREVEALEYEAYPEMVTAAFEAIRARVLKAWPEVRLAMAHRVGRLSIGETSLVLAVGAPHRHQAYGAGRLALEEIKRELPVWKKEIYADGASWKENRPEDPAA